MRDTESLCAENIGLKDIAWSRRGELISRGELTMYYTFRQFRGFVVQSESLESAEIFKSWRFFIFLYWSLKVTALIREITNNECLKGNATKIINFYQFLYHMTHVVIFQVKNWSDSTFCCFVHWEIVPTLLKNNLAFYLVIIQSFPNFPPIPRIRSVIRISGNFWILKIFHLTFLKS